MLIQAPPQPSDYNSWFPPTDQIPAPGPGGIWHPGDFEKRASILQRAFELWSLEAVKTVDPHDLVHPRKALPLYGSMAYLRVPIWGWFRYNRLYWCKGRKVAATVLLTQLVTWECHYASSRLWGWTAQKLDDVQDLVQRHIIQGYVDGAPKWFKRRYTYGKAKGNLVILGKDDQPWGSNLIAYPSGADQLRQEGHSGVVIDEAHTLEDLPGLIQGTAPGLRARAGSEGGKLVIVFVARKGAYVEKLAGPYRKEAVKLATERLSPWVDREAA